MLWEGAGELPPDGEGLFVSPLSPQEAKANTITRASNRAVKRFSFIVDPPNFVISDKFNGRGSCPYRRFHYTCLRKKTPGDNSAVS